MQHSRLYATPTSDVQPLLGTDERSGRSTALPYPFTSQVNRTPKIYTCQIHKIWYSPGPETTVCCGLELLWPGQVIDSKFRDHTALEASEVIGCSWQLDVDIWIAESCLRELDLEMR